MLHPTDSITENPTIRDTGSVVKLKKIDIKINKNSV
jgi:hypothetical protein